MQHVTKKDAIAHEIRPALGEFVTEYDLDAIADEVLEYQNGRFFVRVDDNEFWAIVEKYATEG